MKRFLLLIAIVAPVAGSVWMPCPNDLALAATPTHAAVLTVGPELESATNNLAIIRWTIKNPAGTDLHFGIVHYGTDMMNLNKIAKSPNRRNHSHPDMIFRVRIDGLDAHTTYYYRVESVGATGASDGVSNSVRSFKTN